MNVPPYVYLGFEICNLNPLHSQKIQIFQVLRLYTSLLTAQFFFKDDLYLCHLWQRLVSAPSMEETREREEYKPT